MPKLKEFFYLANIIDYGRVVLLYLALQHMDNWRFCAYYGASYGLDAIDGIVARAMNQTSKLGYYLDMICDRVSSVLCLYAVTLVLPRSFIPPAYHAAVYWFAVANAVLVEILAHGVVCYYAEVCGVHQKLMGGDLPLVRLYLQNKAALFLGCVGFELCSIAVIVDAVGAPENLFPGAWKYISIASFPFMLFRAAANLQRLMACATMKLDSPKAD